ncbi:MAG: DoxX-like family protein [Pseudomonas sp.]|uniref:DoxX-like family protein n=1 Tax=Pseudomonas sp. TaxID=306 RepID=UPI003392520C
MPTPELARLSQLALIARVARLGLAAVFIYHGLVPKIIWLSPQEVAMIAAHGLGDQASWLAPLAGVLEVLLGLALLLPGRRGPLLLAALVLLALLLDVAWFVPSLLVQAFNPLSTNLMALCLCAVAYLAETPARPAANPT